MKMKNFTIYAKSDLLMIMKKKRGHGHFTGRYRGAAHSKCNIDNKISKNISFVSHNGSTYDYHFIIKELA